jgi:hypothetical protein
MVSYYVVCCDVSEHVTAAAWRLVTYGPRISSRLEQMWVNLSERHVLQPKMAACCCSWWLYLERLIWLYDKLWCITFLAWICDSFVAYQIFFTSSLLQNFRGKETYETNIEETISYGNQVPVNVTDNVLEIYIMIQKMVALYRLCFLIMRSSGTFVLC